MGGRMTACPECGGRGVAVYEVGVAAPMAWRGGEIEDREMECELCGGSGDVDEEAAERYDP